MWLSLGSKKRTNYQKTQQIITIAILHTVFKIKDLGPHVAKGYTLHDPGTDLHSRMTILYEDVASLPGVRGIEMQEKRRSLN